MKRKTISFFFLLSSACLLVSPGAEAQDEAQKTFRNSLAVEPLYWLNNGFRLDYERQLKNPAHWLQLSVIGYSVEDEDRLWNVWMLDNHRSLRESWGAGLEAEYKWFPFSRQWLYVSGGLSFAHFDVSYREYASQFITYAEDGLTYYEPQCEERELSQYFNRLATHLYMGIQTSPRRRFLIGAYTGIGYMYSFYDRDKYHPGNHIYNLAYRGVTFTVGFRLGFRL
jgi:hypothetical protein